MTKYSLLTTTILLEFDYQLLALPQRLESPALDYPTFLGEIMDPADLS